jgi:hypothetical protein
VAVIARDVERDRNVDVFSEEELERVADYGPGALAAPIRLLRQWIDGRESLPAPSHAVIPFTTEDEVLTAEDRDLLWRHFQVPIFEQRLSAEGELIAWECEAHDGLHVAGAKGDRRCACGRFAATIPSAAVCGDAR